jgi:magnesium chelatase family protein
MVQRVSTVAFEGIEARAVDVQVQVAPGLPAFAIVGPINPDQLGLGTNYRMGQTSQIASGLGPRHPLDAFEGTTRPYL